MIILCFFENRARGLMITYFSTANISNWCTCSPRYPGDVTHITLADTPTRCTGCNVTNNL